MSRPYHKRVARALLAKIIRSKRRERDGKRADLVAVQSRIEDHLALLIGKLTIAWAEMELHLDRAIHIIHRNGGSVMIQSHLPVSLKPKLQYMRKSRTLLGDNWHGGIIRFCDDAHRLKQLRSDLIHGVAERYDMGKGGWSFVRSEFDKEHRNEVARDQQFGAITAGILEVVKLSGRAAFFTSIIESEFDMKRFRDSQG